MPKEFLRDENSPGHLLVEEFRQMAIRNQGDLQKKVKSLQNTKVGNIEELLRKELNFNGDS